MSEIITQQKVNDEIKMYLQNFQNASAALSTITNDASRNYYNGPEISFIFERNVIEALWKLNPTANGLRVYYGSHDDGTPTLVLIAAEITKDQTVITNCKNLIYSEQISGGEWPDGKGKGTKNLLTSDEGFDIQNDDF